MSETRKRPLEDEDYDDEGEEEEDEDQEEEEEEEDNAREASMRKGLYFFPIEIFNYIFKL